MEGLHEDIDFRSKVSRDEFDNMSKDLLDRAEGPIQTVLKLAGMRMSDIQSIVLVGGNVRIPSVQHRLEQFVGRFALGRNGRDVS